MILGLYPGVSSVPGIHPAELGNKVIHVCREEKIEPGKIGRAVSAIHQHRISATCENTFRFGDLRYERRFGPGIPSGASRVRSLMISRSILSLKLPGCV
jgi:hypothetical protein